MNFTRIDGFLHKFCVQISLGRSDLADTIDILAGLVTKKI